MTPRKASLRVAHQGSCPNANATALDSLTGCKCKPSYYVLSRDRTGRAIKSPRVKSRAVATKTLNKLQVEIDEGRSGQTRPSRLTVAEWADEFERITEGRVRTGDLKPRTLEGYRETLALARTAIGDVPLREVGPSELRDFCEPFEGNAPASRLRHLRQLAVCFAAAVDEGHLTANPVTAFTKKLRLRAPKRGKAPFEVGELERLWTALAAYESVYLYVARFALETGARLGEVVALDWEAVGLTQGRVRIAHTWDATAGLVSPKSGQERVIYLTSEARAVLEEWVRVVGTQTEGPVFPNPFSVGRLNPRMMQRRLETAMGDAGIPRMHPELRLPRSFHSLRYSTSVVMQHRGKHPRLIEQTLGHSSLELTYGVYGGWTPEQLAAEAARSSEGGTL